MCATVSYTSFANYKHQLPTPLQDMKLLCTVPLILQPIQMANITDPQMLKLNAVAVKKSLVDTCDQLAALT